MSLKASLSQPFPYNPALKPKAWMAGFFGLFIFLFLLIFQPFGLDLFSRERLLLVAGIYGVITSVCVFSMTWLMPLLIPRAFSEQVWTTGKQILFTLAIIIMVGLANFLVSPFLVETAFTFTRAVWFQGITVVMALPPVTIFILLRQNQLLKKFKSNAAVIEERLQQIGVNGTEPAEPPRNRGDKIVLTGDYKNEELEIYTLDLHLVTSANNYIKVYHMQKDRLVYSVLRSTIKKAEDVTLPYPIFFKCHRSFIVNLAKVVHVEGNAQGYKLRIEAYEDLIPVSRNLSAAFSDQLLSYRSKRN